MFSQAPEELALVTVLVSNACFRAVTRARLSKMRRLNIMALIILPHHSAKIADHSHGLSGRGVEMWGEKRHDFVMLHSGGIHRRLKLLLFMSGSYLISTVVP